MIDVTRTRSEERSHLIGRCVFGTGLFISTTMLILGHMSITEFAIILMITGASVSISIETHSIIRALSKN